jgi:hypothetical protein
MLFVVLTIVIGAAILALGFNAFKRGSIEQLAKTADQNRLMVLCQAGNNEMLALVKAQANETIFCPSARDSAFFQAFRKGFQDGVLPCEVQIPDRMPPETRKLAEKYGIEVKSQVNICLRDKLNTTRSLACGGYIEVISRANHKTTKSTFEIKERREIKVVDSRDLLDKYGLFVKCFSPDLNNSSRRVKVVGIPTPDENQWRSQIFTHVFLGKRNYPEVGQNQITQKNITLDLNIAEQGQFVAKLFGISGGSLKPFPLDNHTGQNFSDPNKYGKLLWLKKDEFSSFGSGFSDADLMKLDDLKRTYLALVHSSAEGLQNTGTVFADPPNPAALKTLCQNAKAAVGTGGSPELKKIVDDYLNKVSNPPSDYRAANLASSDVFKKMVQEGKTQWKYHFGFTDAETLWDLNTGKLREFEPRSPTEFGKAAAYSGFASFFDEHVSPTEPKDKNMERPRVGKMLDLYGGAGGTDWRPVLVEGDVYVRFFKLACLDEAKFAGGAFGELVVPATPLRFGRSASVLNQALGSDLFTPPIGQLKPMDAIGKKLMSEPEYVPINRVLADHPEIKLVEPWGDAGDNMFATYNPADPTLTKQVLTNPSQKGSGGTGASAEYFFPNVKDRLVFSSTYYDAVEFLHDKYRDGVLYLDGKCVILTGGINLKNVKRFHGNGFIYVPYGDCIFGDELKKTKDTDLMKIFLQNGDFLLQGDTDTAEIHASLMALTFDEPTDSITVNPALRADQGKLVPNGKKMVKIRGNLVVDYLFTEGDKDDPPGTALAAGGWILIEHDTALMADPALVDPFRVSIGPIRTMYAMSAGGGGE